MIPIPTGRQVSSVTRNGSAAAFATATIKGMTYVFVMAEDAAYQVTFSFGSVSKAQQQKLLESTSAAPIGTLLLDVPVAGAGPAQHRTSVPVPVPVIHRNADAGITAARRHEPRAAPLHIQDDGRVAVD
jgi:hypothetical protein